MRSITVASLFLDSITEKFIQQLKFIFNPKVNIDRTFTPICRSTCETMKYTHTYTHTAAEEKNERSNWYIIFELLQDNPRRRRPRGGHPSWFSWIQLPSKRDGNQTAPRAICSRDVTFELNILQNYKMELHQFFFKAILSNLKQNKINELNCVIKLVA